MGKLKAANYWLFMKSDIIEIKNQLFFLILYSLNNNEKYRREIILVRSFFEETYPAFMTNFIF